MDINIYKPINKLITALLYDALEPQYMYNERFIVQYYTVHSSGFMESDADAKKQPQLCFLGHHNHNRLTRTPLIDMTHVASQ